MKKTVTVNISGVVFTMDEDAYDALQKYLNKIKSYFSQSDGRDEIISDIEARIAEMFAEKVSDKQQVVTIAHVEEMIEIMGKPEDYIDGEESEAQEPKNRSYNHSTKYKTKRLYRDGDDNVLGGVCSGIGYYFGFDPLWLRIAFVASFFLFGSGIGLYIILWIIVPEAKSTAEKLEMKGEAVTFENIGKAVEDEMENWSTKFSENAENWRAKGHHRKAKNFFHRIVDFFLSILGGLLKFFGKILGIILIVFGAFLLLPVLFSFLDSSEIFISWTTEGITSFSIPEMSYLVFGSESLTTIAVIAFCLFLGVPAVAILIGGIKLLFGVKSEVKGIGIALTSIWIIGLILMCYSGYKVGIQFKDNAEHVQTVELPANLGDTLNLNISKDVLRMSDKKRYRNHGEAFSLLKITEDEIYNGDVELTIKEADQDSFKLDIIQESQGKSESQALEFAKEIKYNFVLEGNSLVFDPYFRTSPTDPLRGQQVDIVLYIPQGKSVYLSDNLVRILYGVDNFTNTHDLDMVDKIWTMTDRGLECIGCPKNEL